VRSFFACEQIWNLLFSLLNFSPGVIQFPHDVLCFADVDFSMFLFVNSVESHFITTVTRLLFFPERCESSIVLLTGNPTETSTGSPELRLDNLQRFGLFGYGKGFMAF
jgi:hypothetical protein